jgi:hypothetical protein
MRASKGIFKIQPLQNDTAELIPNSAVPGVIKAVANVVGTALAAKVTLARNNFPLTDGKWEIEVTGTNAYTVTNVDTGFVSAELTGGATANATVVPGVDVTVTDVTGITTGDKCAFEVVGDQTYIIPGTTLGRIATGTYKGKWRPVMPYDVLTTFDQFRIAANFQETDKNKTVLPTGYEHNLSDVYIIDVVVYGQIIEAVCNDINLKAVTGLKATMPFYAWI